MKKLTNKIAVIYGNGAVGGAVARAFAKEGAEIFLAGRTPAKQRPIVDDIIAGGGVIETAVLDSLDGKAVEDHMGKIIEKTGRIDISFNATGLSQIGIQGIPLAELSEEGFLSPINSYLKNNFITAKAAASRMTKQNGGGVILMHTPNASHISPPFVGGMVPAWSAIEGLCRSLSVEYGQQGLRSVCLLTTGIPETPLIDEVWEIHGKAHGITFQQFHEVMTGATHRKRLTTLSELSAAAVFAASDEGSAMTGTTFNLTAGMIV
ncbi:MAG: SDR family oxidoreductase [Bacteroidetes bacterium]|nr:SDR family oxidoreductase [Bacteroidota bacterium]